MDIRTKIIFENNDNIEKELKNLDSISLDDIKSERIIKLCNHHKSNTYINPIGGKELYNKEYFKKRDINLFFVETNAFNYKQYDKCFIPYLSIIDILMHSGIEETKSIIKKYQLN